MEEPKPYTVIDRRKPPSEEELQKLCDRIVEENKKAGYVSAAEATQVLERAPDPQPGETRKANRRERKTMAKQAKAEAKKMERKTFTYEAPEARPELADTSPIDPIRFLGEIANNLNMAVADNERLRARIPAGERMMADEMQMAAQLGFMLGYLEAYGPADEQDRLRIISIAQDLKKKFKFRSPDGELAKPKPAPTIIAPPPSILLV